MSFFLYPGNKLEILSGICCRLIDDDPGSDPLAPETIVVQTQGMAAYLRQFMAQRSGIAANINMPFPAGFISGIIQQNIPGFEEASKAFSQEMMVWEIFSIFKEEAADFSELNGFISGDGSSDLKCWQLADRTAALFDRYQIYRYKDEYFPLKKECWQSRLWRKLLQRFGKSKMECFREFLNLRTPLKGLPQRLTVFGVGSLPPLYLDIFFKIAEEIDLRFFYMTPCREFWEHLYSVKEQRWYCKSDEIPEPGNPLLASWGTAGRELFVNLMDQQNITPYVSSEELLFEDYVSADSGISLLNRLQQDILTMTDRRSEPQNLPADDSVEILNCHAPRREVEVLHDKLLTLLDRKEVQLRDIIIMAPDINIYLPYIDAVFGRGPLKYCYTVSDRNLHSGSGVGNIFSQLLELTSSRMEVSEVLAVLRHPAVCSAFGIAPGELPVVSQWIEECGIRWGVDADDHARFCSVAFEEFSWFASFDRMFELFARGSNEVEDIVGHPPLLAEEHLELFGKLYRFVRELNDLRRQLGEMRTLGEWMDFCRRILNRFFCASDKEQQREIALLCRFAGDKKMIAANMKLSMKFSIDVVKELFAGFLNSIHDRFSFLRGKITFCSLTPLRSVPAKVIAVLGLNDRAFPRRDIELGFDMMSASLLPGDRSSAKEDRYLFLEALMSARRSFWCFYNGRSRRTGKKLEPAVILGEFMDYLEQSYGISEIQHCLQGFDSRYFSNDSPFYSWSQENFSTAKLLASRRDSSSKGSRILIGDGSDECRSAAPLDELIRWAQHPAEWIFKNQLQVNFSFPENAGSAEMIHDVDPLQQYHITRSLAELERTGVDADRSYLAMKNNNMLPPGAAGRKIFNTDFALLNSIDSEWKQNFFDQQRLSMKFEIPGEQPFAVAGVFNCSAPLNRQLILNFSALKHKHYVNALMRHHALCMISDSPEITTSLLYMEKKEWKEIKWINAGKNRISTAFWLRFIEIWQKWRNDIPALFPDTLFKMFTANVFSADDIAEKCEDIFAKEHKGNPVIARCFSVDALKDPSVCSELLEFLQLFYQECVPEEENE